MTTGLELHFDDDNNDPRQPYPPCTQLAGYGVDLCRYGRME